MKISTIFFAALHFTQKNICATKTHTCHIKLCLQQQEQQQQQEQEQEQEQQQQQQRQVIQWPPCFGDCNEICVYIYTFTVYIKCFNLFHPIPPIKPPQKKKLNKKKTRFSPGKDQAVCPGLDCRVVLGEGVFHKRHVGKGLTPHIYIYQLSFLVPLIGWVAYHHPIEAIYTTYILPSGGVICSLPPFMGTRKLH